jgi:two-component system, NarL family, response regulator LiaR
MLDRGFSPVSTQAVRVLIVEDHVFVREGTRELIQRDPAVEVVGEAGTAEEALTLTERLRPDVVLLDLALPDRNGIDVLPALCEKAPDARIVVLSAYDDGDYVVAAIEAGAAGYLLKTARGQEVVEAIHAVGRGQVVLQAEVAGELRRSLRRGSTGRDALSPREMEILRLAARGWRNRDIASEMGISVRTVEGHLSHVLGKLGLSSRTEAVVYGAAHGWFELD